MDKTQYATFELGRYCNLGKRHRKCPNQSPERYAGLDTSRVLDDETIINIARRMYGEFGFRGMVALHYYNEPLCQGFRAARLMHQIRTEVPAVRFALWTNGTLLSGQAEALAEEFAHIHVTDYTALGQPPEGLVELKAACEQTDAELEIQSARMDKRLTCASMAKDAPCGRMCLEIIWDRHGYNRLCCFAWTGAGALGNIYDVSLDVQIEQWVQIRDGLLAGGRMAPDAPAVCRTCSMRHRSVNALAPQLEGIAEEANNYIQQRLEGGAPLVGPEAPKITTTVRTEGSIPWWGQLSEAYCLPRIVSANGQGEPVTSADLYAIVGTWHEADVIEAIVRHYQHHGCREVYIVDNASPDETVELARQAGAQIADVYETDHYHENERLWRMNRVMERVMKRRARRYPAWWLFVDADEFMQPRGGLLLRDYVAGLPDNVDGVWAEAFDMYPTHKPAYVPGTHPADQMSYGMGRRFCGRHRKKPWKMPLICQRDKTLTFCQTRGMHEPYALPTVARQMRVTADTLVIHHCPFREEAATRQRLQVLCGPRPGAQHRSITDDLAINGNGAIKRYRTLDAVYAGQWDQVTIAHGQAFKSQTVALQHYRELFSEIDYQPQRWY